MKQYVEVVEKGDVFVSTVNGFAKQGYKVVGFQVAGNEKEFISCALMEREIADFDNQDLKRITELDIPIRVVHCLHNNGITTIGELMQYSKRKLLSLRDFGQRSLQELEESLAELDITLRRP